MSGVGTLERVGVTRAKPKEVSPRYAWGVTGSYRLNKFKLLSLALRKREQSTNSVGEKADELLVPVPVP